MRPTTALAVTGLLTLVFACAAQSEQKDPKDPFASESGGASSDVKASSMASNSSGGSSVGAGGTSSTAVFVPDMSGSTGGTAVTDPGAGVAAEQTPNGMLEISAVQANQILSDPATSCAGWSEHAERASSVLEFIVDVSGSMGESTPATGGQTKWAVTRRALLDAITQLPNGLAVGMTFFPVNGQGPTLPASASTCIDTSKNIPIAPLSEVQLANLIFAVDTMKSFVDGATPTHDAYDIALAAIRADTNPGQKHLVLITDGQPTLSKGCVGTGQTCPPRPTAPIIEAISAALASDQVKTFVVGSPGSEINQCSREDIRAWLSAAARAGGTAVAGCSDQGPNYCHFDLTQGPDFATALSAALGDIVKTVVSCDYAVPSASTAAKTIDTNRVNIIYEDGSGGYSVLLSSKTPDCQKGWQFADASLSKIHICTETCAQIQSNPQAKLSLVVGCTQEQIQTPIL